MSDRTKIMCGAIEGMGGLTLHIVDAAKAVEYEKGQVVLLGLCGLTYFRQIKQHGSLLNFHYMHDIGVLIEDTDKKYVKNSVLSFCMQLGTPLSPLCSMDTS